MKTKDKRPSFTYPDWQDRRDGCKVSWLYYKEKWDAEAASKVAVKEGQYMAGLGYDFGYCAPGYITEVEHRRDAGGTDLGRMYEVCIP
jgi:hypothetical protein